jgi:predicted DNA-binding mobile mystery protein A
MKYMHAQRSRLLLDTLAQGDRRIIKQLQRPPSGWLRTVRQALNMPQRELARRLGVSQPSVQALERRELSGAITIEALERAADALGCDLVYALIPRRPLQDTLKEQAENIARAQWAAVAHTMALEDQQVPASDETTIEELTRRTMSAGTAVWPSDA